MLKQNAHRSRNVEHKLRQTNQVKPRKKKQSQNSVKYQTIDIEQQSAYDRFYRSGEKTKWWTSTKRNKRFKYELMKAHISQRFPYIERSDCSFFFLQ